MPPGDSGRGRPTDRRVAPAIGELPVSDRAVGIERDSPAKERQRLLRLAPLMADRRQPLDCTHIVGLLIQDRTVERLRLGQTPGTVMPAASETAERFFLDLCEPWLLRTPCAQARPVRRLIPINGAGPPTMPSSRSGLPRAGGSCAGETGRSINIYLPIPSALATVPLEAASVT